MWNSYVTRGYNWLNWLNQLKIVVMHDSVLIFETQNLENYSLTFVIYFNVFHLFNCNFYINITFFNIQKA